jgi:hypothetical protein
LGLPWDFRTAAAPTGWEGLDFDDSGWARKRGGGYACDFTALDGYLDFATEYWGTPRVINFVVNQPLRRTSSQAVMPPVVHVLDEATGERQALEVGAAVPEAEHRRFWRDVANAIYGHNLGLRSCEGWKRKNICLLFTRTGRAFRPGRRTTTRAMARPPCSPP